LSMLSSNRNSSRVLDYRDNLIVKRLEGINHVILVGGGKGGVGKSLVAATMGLLLSRSSFKTGLLDLDLHGPSLCQILKISGQPTEEAEGLIPPSVLGLRVMSIDPFAKGRPLPLSGIAKEEIIKEILAITAFGPLDYLIIDLPPGTGDELLTISRHIRGKASAIIITTPSQLSIATAKRLIQILDNLKIRVIGFIENMVIEVEDGKQSPATIEATFLGQIHFDPEVAYRLEDLEPENILKTRFAAQLKQILLGSGFSVQI
jgi:ATP-binding protein involved in chromosome partitioning